MQRAGWAAIVGVVAGVTFASSVLAGPVIERATLDAGGAGAATLTLALSDALKPRIFRLESPDRIVVDLPDTRLASNVRLPEGAGPVTVMRSGVQPNALRLVLEMKGSYVAHTRLISAAGEGHRLVVDLAPRGGVPAAPAVEAPVPATPVVSAPAVPAPQPVPRAPRIAEGRDIIVAIDAGHGGQDPGAIGRSGTREKDVVLGIATALARRIDAEPGMKAVLTRDNDRFIPLRDRMTLARKGRADLFVSIHADAIANRTVSGSSVYVLSNGGATSEAARWLAERENAADLKGGVALSEQGALASVLMDLSQTASIGSSMEAAELVLSHMDRVGEVRKSRVQQAGFVVLKSPDIPSMLVETAYISNPAEEKKLRTPAHQERIANAIFSGVRDYFRASPPDGTLYTQRQRGGNATVLAVTAAP